MGDMAKVNTQRTRDHSYPHAYKELIDRLACAVGGRVLGSWLLLLLEKAHLKDVFGFGVGETLLDGKGRMG